MSMTSSKSRALALFLILANGCVRDEPASSPSAAARKITKDQAILMLGEAEWDEFRCVEGTRSDGRKLFVKKIHPKERDRIAQGPFWVREEIFEGDAVRLQDEFFTEPREAIEAMAKAGVSEFQECRKIRGM